MSESVKPNLEYKEEMKLKMFDECFINNYNKTDQNFGSKLLSCINNMSIAYKNLLNNYNERIPEYEVPMAEEEDEDDE